MNSKIFLTTVAAVALVAGAAEAKRPPSSFANLSGQIVDVDLFADGSDFGNQSVLVGAGADGNYFNNQFFDLNGGLNGDEFTVQSSSSFSGIAGGGGTVTWTLTNLDFGAPLIGFNILQDIGPVTIDSLTATSVTFSYQEAAIPPGVYFVGQFITGGAVPEPAAWALMLMGFGAIGATLRGKRRDAVAA